MQCCVCHKKPATVHLTQIVVDKMQRLSLCAECAKAKGVNDSDSIDISDFMHNVEHMMKDSGPENRKQL
jgi:protein arginine kinase activator